MAQLRLRDRVVGLITTRAMTPAVEDQQRTGLGR